MEKFEVTGSRLSGAAAEGSLSVSLYKLDTLTTQGYSDVGEMLRRKLPQFGGGIGTINDAFGNGGSGQSTISLRNLPGSRTLFLINGRRTTADLNMVPTIAIDRVEVLNDGASAVYGSEAIAGVVNVILKKNYQGLEVSGRYANTTDTDISERRFGVFAGGATTTTRISVGAEYSKANDLFSVDRAVSQPTGDQVSGTSNPGVFVPRATAAETAAATAAGNVLVPLRWFVNPAGTTGLTSAGQIPAAFNPSAFVTVPSSLSAVQRNAARDAEETRLNGVLGASAPVRYGSNAVLGEGLNPGFPFGFYTPAYRPFERQNVLFSFEHDFSDVFTLFADVRYSKNKTQSALAPSPLSGGTVPATNYWATQVFPSLAGSDRSFTYGYRPVELGPRVSFGTIEDRNIVIGGRGTLADSRFKYEVAFMHDKWKYAETQTGGVLADVYSAALASGDPATAFNPFGYTAVGETASPVNTAAIIDPFRGSASSLDTYKIEQIDANISGNVFDLPAGAIEVALGAEYREETQNDMPDEALASGAVFPFNITAPFNASRDITSFYVEANVPILSTVSVSAAGRVEDYSDVGSTGLKPRVSVRWEVIPDQLTLRGSWAQGFVAPSLETLGAEPGQDFTELLNPITGIRTQPDNGTFTTSNPALEPAESDSYLLGFVYSPKPVKGLTVGANYYRIEESKIPFESGQYIVNQWFAAGPTDPNNPFGPTATPSAVNPLGAQVELTPTGDINEVRNVGPINSGERLTDGVDLFAFYNFRTAAAGEFTIGASWTRVLTFEQEDFPGAGTIDYLGRYWGSGAALGNYGFPKWKGSFNVDWKAGSLSASVGYNYTSGYLEDENDNNEIEAYQTFDLRVGYEFEQLKTRLSVGVNNVLDEQPPFIITSFENGFDRAIADIRGRMIFVELNKRF